MLWLSLAITFAGFAFAAVLAAMTTGGKALLHPFDLLIVAAAFVLAMVLCIGAHRDVNRGRTSKERVVEEIDPPG